MDKELGRLGSLTLVEQAVYGKTNTELKPAVLYLKIDLVSHRVGNEGFG